jgi:hypothetical protein
MKDHHKAIIVTVLVALAALAVYAVFSAISSGIKEVGSLIDAPFSALKSAGSAISDFVGGIFDDFTDTSIPSLGITPTQQQTDQAVFQQTIGGPSALDPSTNPGGYFQTSP